MQNINLISNNKFLRTLVYSAAFLFALVAFSMIAKPHSAHAAQDFVVYCYNSNYNPNPTNVMASVKLGLVVEFRTTSGGPYGDVPISYTASFTPAPAAGNPTISYVNNPSSNNAYSYVYLQTYNNTTPGGYTTAISATNGTYTHSCNVTVSIAAYNASVSASIKCNGVASDCSIPYYSTPGVSWTSSGTTNCYLSGPPDASYRTSWFTSSGSYTAGHFQDDQVFVTLSCWTTGFTQYLGIISEISINSQPIIYLYCNYQSPSCTINAGDSATISWTGFYASNCTVTPGNWSGTYNYGTTQTTPALITTTVYTANCTGPSGGNTSTTVTVNVTPGPYGVVYCNGLGACTIPYNTAATITWSSYQQTSCSISPSGWTGTSGSQSTGNLTANRTYTINCSGPGGAATPHSVTVTVSPPPLPTGSITCNGAASCTIAYNSAATIAWTTTNATSCTVSPSSWTGTTGSVSTGNLTATTTYTLACSGPGGNATIGSVVVTVSPPPPVTGNILCNGGGNCSIPYNTAATISWSSANATSCSVSPNSWTGLTGSQSTGLLTYTTVYTLSCTGPAGALSPQPTVTVTVLTDFTLSCTPLTTAIALGDTTSFQMTITRQGVGNVTFAAPTFSPTSGNNPVNTYTNNPNASGSGVTSGVITTTMSTALAAPYQITYTASAVGGAGTVTHSCTVNLYISATPPVQPTNLFATNAVCETVDLGWQKGAGTSPAGYRVYRHTVGTGTATDAWAQVGADIPTTASPSYNYHDGSPLLPHGANYYGVSSYDSNNLESAKVNANPVSIVPRYCGPSLTTSDIDLTQVAGHVSKTFTGQACSGTSEIAQLPSNSLFSPNDTVTFVLSICNSGTQDITGGTANVSAMNLTNYSIVSSSPNGCLTGQTVNSTTMSLTFGPLTAPPNGVIATSCSITYRATITLPGGITNQYQRFQSVTDVTTNDGLTDHIVTPPYLFGTGGNQPNRNETSPH